MIENQKISAHTGHPREVFMAFLTLGLTSFGGPIAHLGYFRAELVERRRWINDDQFGHLLAICQFLPGPASSQLGFSLGLLRAGWLGALAAFIAFTLPSALMLLAFAAALPLLSGPIGLAAVHGLKLVACAVVANAVLGMSRKLCPDVARQTISVLSTAALLIVTSPMAQLVVVALAGIIGIFILRGRVAIHDDANMLPVSFSTRTGGLLIAAFVVFLVGLPIMAASIDGLFSVAEAFYRAGALVFGGGHVVLPLLQESVVASGRISPDQFLAGYGASQAIPGPMFAFSAYLGAVLSPTENTYLSAATALIFIFLPGFLLVAGVLPFWQAVARNHVASSAIAGVNAAIVGLLGAALYDPIFISGISNPIDLAIALVGFGMLVTWRISPLIVVLWCVAASVLQILV
jgi:chromate transporter